MKKILRHYFRPAVAALVLSAASATAADPPKLRVPEQLKPTLLNAFAKSAERVDPNVEWLKVPAAWKVTRGEGEAGGGPAGAGDARGRRAAAVTDRRHRPVPPAGPLHPNRRTEP